MRTYLKIKIKSLAAEARIIRQEERKWPGPSDVRHGLHNHRVVDVRMETRSALLAYGFIRGKEYRKIETFCYSVPNGMRIAQLAVKYGGTRRANRVETENAVNAWLKEPISKKSAA